MTWKNKSKESIREYHRDWYHKNKHRIRKSKQRLSQNRKKKINVFVRSLKEVPCKDCGNSYPYYVMDFDHVRGEKKFNISNGSRNSFNKLKNEIEKCDVVCSNCHRVRTFNRIMSGSNSAR